MEHRPIAGAKRHQRRGWRQQPVGTMTRNGWVVALVCPSMGEPGGEALPCCHDNRATRKRRDWGAYRKHTLPFPTNATNLAFAPITRLSRRKSDSPERVPRRRSFEVFGFDYTSR